MRISNRAIRVTREVHMVENLAQSYFPLIGEQHLPGRDGMRGKVLSGYIDCTYDEVGIFGVNNDRFHALQYCQVYRFVCLVTQLHEHWRACSVQWNDVPTVYGLSIANAREGCQAQKDLPCSFRIFWAVGSPSLRSAGFYLSDTIGIDPPGSCNMTFSYLCFRSTVTLTTHRRSIPFMAMQLDQRITLDFDVPARMRDGTILRANVYRPASEGQWPVLLTRLPYGKDFPLGSSVMDPAQVARRGYVFIVQDTCGPFSAEGGRGAFLH